MKTHLCAASDKQSASTNNAIPHVTKVQFAQNQLIHDDINHENHHNKPRSVSF